MRSEDQIKIYQESLYRHIINTKRTPVHANIPYLVERLHSFKNMLIARRTPTKGSIEMKIWAKVVICLPSILVAVGG